MAAQQSVARVGAVPVAARPGAFKTSKRILGRDWPIAWMFFLPTALLLFQPSSFSISCMTTGPAAMPTRAAT